jgi:fatty-acyl-CoA synthase
VQTIDQLIRDRAGDTRVGLAFSDRTWTHDQVVSAQAERAALLLWLRRPGPFHVALLMDNVPEYVFWMGAAALAGAVVVGGNPTHRGDELARDLSHTECQLLITNPTYRGLVEGHDLGPALPPERILVIDDPSGDVSTDRSSPYAALLADVAGAPLPDQAAIGVTEETLGLLLFTSGTSGAPKACLCSQGRLARIGSIVAQMYSLTPDDVCYLAMPLFHSNALMAGWAPALAAGATAALRERFSASQFLVDVRRYGVTYFNYVGKPLSYILATPEHPDDAENTLRQCFGNEAAEADVAAFASRFGCAVQDAYGSTEGGATVQRTPDTPRGALGRALPGTLIFDTDTGEECPRAVFDAKGRLLNAEEAIGEMVSQTGAAGFEGYWRNAEAEASRVKNGWYWTGDLAYRDEDDFFYFAGRDYDWLRVDGENFASAPVEAILHRHPDVLLASVYAVPDTVVGDQVMATLLLHEGRRFDPDGFWTFLEGEEDLGTKWAPKFVRVTDQLPETATT